MRPSKQVETCYLILEERRERGGKVGPKSIGKRSDEISCSRDEDGVVFCRVLGGLFSLLLIRILLTQRLLVEDLDGHTGDSIEPYGKNEIQSYE